MKMMNQEAYDYMEVEENTTFKFPVKTDLIGLPKMSHLSELRYLEKLDLKGYKFIGSFNGFYYFGVDTQLARGIKLAPMYNSVLPHKLKFIMSIIDRSQKVEGKEELNRVGTNYWYYCNPEYYFEEDKLFEKQNQKNKIKYQNNLYKQKLKIKR